MNHLKTTYRPALAVILTLLLCLFTYGPLAAQTARIDISGTVKDNLGEPLIGVTVNETGTSNTAVTDLDGHFQLRSVARTSRLKFSYVGMADKTLPVSGTTMNVTMTAEDRKSTRLNSSHRQYLVCRLLLEKKKKNKTLQINTK